MNKYDKKYGFKEDKKIKDFHRSRRMFAVIDGKLVIAESSLPYSHAQWFESLGFLGEDNDKMMASTTRGIIDEKGDIYFYSGYDFEINDKNETEFFGILDQLIEKLKLKNSSKVYGGMIKKQPGEIWPPIKTFGEIGDLT